MNVNNFIVRPKRKLVEKYADAKAWEKLDAEERSELVGRCGRAAFRTCGRRSGSEAVRLADVAPATGTIAAREVIHPMERRMCVEIAGALEEKASIPMVRAELELIIEIQTDEFWQDVTTPMLEDVRKRLRSLVKFIETDKTARMYLYGLHRLDRRGTEIELPGFECRIRRGALPRQDPAIPQSPRERSSDPQAALE